MSRPMDLTDTLDKIHKDTDGDTIKISDIIDALEHRGFGPLLLAAALMSILPTGGIPGVPTLTAALITLISGQLLFGKTRPWVPDFLENRSIKKAKFEKAREKVRPFTKIFDHLLKPRLQALTTPTMNRIVAGISIVLACAMPPLELLPFVAMLPALAIGLLAVGLSAKDGLFIAIGLFVALIVLPGSIYLLQ